MHRYNKSIGQVFVCKCVKESFFFFSFFGRILMIRIKPHLLTRAISRFLLHTHTGGSVAILTLCFAPQIEPTQCYQTAVAHLNGGVQLQQQLQDRIGVFCFFPCLLLCVCLFSIRVFVVLLRYCLGWVLAFFSCFPTRLHCFDRAHSTGVHFAN